MQRSTPRRSINPVEAYRKQQKQKEQLKIKDARDKRRRDEEESHELNAVMEKELKELAEVELSRTLSAAERARRRELREALENSKAATMPAKRKMGAHLVDDKPLPTGLFDPLSEQHRSAYEKAKKHRERQVAEQVKIESAAAESEAAARRQREQDALEGKLPDDFLPELPMEVFPPWHKPKKGPMLIRITGGYPRPPLEPPPPSAAVFSLERTNAKTAAPVMRSQSSSEIVAAPVIRKFANEALAMVPTSVLTNKNKAPAAPPVVIINDANSREKKPKAGISAEEKNAQDVDGMYDKFLEEMGDLI